ncbi:MAG TPA: asparagine synthase (glutamine-hydrolyzing) [Myxococcota bacterium]|nr:asparagine synthase (glutamine-hydrolyzing) [Myxococcota bacterium]HNZ03896.1 asparagine synthase (glutamine-hydrolyzing) [Myxococcota bacterium]HOD07836.1 asparagine synthase (glutamine-hydrolyzing) [Myxococcota bacterium]HPB50773.1 asparagine synthase (glutamine-hydrolyzing) [Myxococcota bacterium]HQP95818.1 asparagine synthase (glutamine-hydrolyzing) [Myxococcota bacterium]
MCGITGFTRFGGACQDDDAVLSRMTASLSHRGPDDDGRWIGNGACLGHRRLSIIDVAGGRQPLLSEDGQVVVVCNGEIYNHHELRALVISRGHRLSTRSDCEVLVHLWEDEGTAMLERLDGMFAFALWDSRTRTLALARDRMGKKPLFWSRVGRDAVFGSELRAVVTHPDVSRRVDPTSLYRFLTLDYVPTPYSIFEGVFKVQPGGFVVIDAEGVREGRFHELTVPLKPTETDERTAARDVWDSLVRATGARLESEVPLGVFLSGGLDSGAVLAAMAEHVDPAGISTFTIGFEDPTFDESAPAGLVAKKFGTKHHVRRISGAQALELVQETPTIADEPLADYSILATTLLSRFAREHVTVALSGDGGDELFYGYDTFRADRWASFIDAMPLSRLFKRVLPAAASMIPVSDRNMGLDYKVSRMARGLRYGRYERHLAWTGSFDPADVRPPAGVLSDDFAGMLNVLDSDPYPDVNRVLQGAGDADPLKLLSLLYARLYLLDGVLVKVDRASMSTGLEVRSPFLDTRMVELAMSLPPGLNLNGGRTKQLMRTMLEGRLPDEILTLPKKGFGVPMASWLRADLRPLLEDLLSPERLRRQGIFRPEAVSFLVDSHMSKKRNCRKELFNLLVFQLWHQRWLS